MFTLLLNLLKWKNVWANQANIHGFDCLLYWQVYYETWGFPKLGIQNGRCANMCTKSWRQWIQRIASTLVGILLRRREAYNMAATSPLPQLWARCGESPHLALVDKLMLTTHISIQYILLIDLKPLVEYVTVHFASHFRKVHQTIYADPHVAKRKA